MRLGPTKTARLMFGLTVSLVITAVVVITLILVAGESEPRVGSTGTVALAAAPATKTPDATRTVATITLSAHGAPLDAYQGLASWVDVYDSRAWRDPAAAVRDMSRHGVRTIFVQTSHFNSRNAIVNPKALSEFIVEGHAHGMRVVAWYLPNMRLGSVDYERVIAAVKFRTADGQAFDSFGMDIESGAIHSQALRNHGLKVLSKRVRAYVGPSYPLGAIIPAPAALRKDTSVWKHFPYAMVAKYYDVFVPMAYYTYHGHTAQSAYNDARANLSVLRSSPGCENMPVHMIGGIAQSSSTAEVKAFVSAVVRGNCLGASIYGWTGTRPGAWRALSAIKP
jgi:hypothetical protein